MIISKIFSTLFNHKLIFVINGYINFENDKKCLVLNQV